MAMTKRYTTVNGQIMFAEQVSEPGKSMALVPDTLGNVIANKDVNGDMVRTCEYWPYGEIRTETSGNPTPFGYGGTWGYYSDPSGRLVALIAWGRPDRPPHVAFFWECLKKNCPPGSVPIFLDGGTSTEVLLQGKDGQQEFVIPGYTRYKGGRPVHHWIVVCER